MRKGNKTKNTFRTIALLLLLFISISPIIKVSSEAFTKMYVDPEDLTKAEGETFTINVDIFNVTNVYTWQFRLRWNATLLDVKKIDEGPFLKQQGYQTLFAKPINQASGYADVSCTRTGVDTPGASGNGTLATVTIFAETWGYTNLTLANTLLIPAGYEPGDPTIPHDTFDGHLTILARPIASFTVSPTIPVPEAAATFDASTSYDPDGTIANYTWNFGDSTDPVTVTDPIITHTFSIMGDYNVTLTVADNDGITGETWQIVRVLLPLIVEPDSGPMGTKVLLKGNGFNPYTEVVLYFDDQVIMPPGTLFADAEGRFNVTFNVPLAEPGLHLVKVLISSLINYTIFLVIDNEPLDINMDVGGIHFRGEIAEFYIQTVFKGIPVDATVTATLYKPDETSQQITVQPISTGLYKASYTIPTNAPVGTYALVAEGNYTDTSESVKSLGASLKSFLLSSTLTAWNAWLTDITNNIATIKTDIGIIKTNITDINARIINIEDNVAVIQTDIGTITTNMDTLNTQVTTINGNIVTIQTAINKINGDITSINGKIATIQTDVGTIKTTLQDWTGTTTSVVIPEGTFKILSLTTSSLESPATYSDKTLTVTISGTTGTTGHTNVILPKAFLTSIDSTIDKIGVTIDDQTVSFTNKDLAQVYVLQIPYTHSTHTIKVYLLGVPTAPFPITTAVAIVILILIAIGIVAYMRKTRKTPKPQKPEAPPANSSQTTV